MSLISKLTTLGAAGSAGGAQPWALRISRNEAVGSGEGIYPTENTITPDHENGTYAILYDAKDDNTLVYRIDEDGSVVWRTKQSTTSGFAQDAAGSMSSSGYSSDLFVMGDFGASNYGYRLNSSGTLQAYADVWGGKGGVICSDPNVTNIFTTNVGSGDYKVQRLNPATMESNYNTNNRILYINNTSNYYPFKFGSKLVYFPTDGSHAVYSTVMVSNHSQGVIKSDGTGTYTYKYVNYTGRDTTPSFSQGDIGKGYYESGTAKFKYYMTDTSTRFHEFTVDKNLDYSGSQYSWTTSGINAYNTGVTEDSSGNRYFCLGYNSIFKVDTSNNVEWGIQITLSGAGSASYSSQNANLSFNEDALYFSCRIRTSNNYHAATYIIKIPTDGGIAAGTYTDAGTTGDWQNISITVTDRTSALTPRATTLTGVSTGSATVSTNNGSPSDDNVVLSSSTQTAFNGEVLTEL